MTVAAALSAEHGNVHEFEALLPDWADPFLRPARYKSARGGRGSAKTHMFSQITVLRMRGLLLDYEPEPVRIASARQFQNSITESMKTTVEHYIRLYGLWDEFSIGKFAIDCPVTGAHMWFPGFHRHPESLVGTEGMDVLWIEQAETIGEEMEKIIPTVRKPGSELWFSWNPAQRAQWCWRRFEVNPRSDDVSIHVNYDMNPWFPDELKIERRALKEEEPDRYPHVWLGEPDDTDADKQVLTYVMLEKCVEGYEKQLYPSQTEAPLCDAGLDLAEGGKDRCALVIRRGPVIESLHKWPGVVGDLSQAAQKAHGLYGETRRGSGRLYYDASSPIKTEFRRLRPGYRVIGEQFGGGVKGANTRYESGRPNDQVFRSRNIQLADALRLRASRTVRLLDGQDVDPKTCLFINPAIPRLETFLTDMTQPIRRVNQLTGKWELDKRGGDENAESPDAFDAASLAFARDSETGLRAR